MFFVHLVITGVLMYFVWKESLIALLIFMFYIFICVQFLRTIVNKHNELLLDKVLGTGRRMKIKPTVSPREKMKLEGLRDKIETLKRAEKKDTPTEH